MPIYCPAWLPSPIDGVEVVRDLDALVADADHLVLAAPATPKTRHLVNASLLERVKPGLHLFGHIHQDGGLWTHGDTVFANVTTWECERGPTVIDIDGNVVTPVVGAHSS